MERHRGADGAEGELAAVAAVGERSAPGVATGDVGEVPHDAMAVPTSDANAASATRASDAKRADVNDADEETRPRMTRGLYTAARCSRTAHVAPLARDC